MIDILIVIIFYKGFSFGTIIIICKWLWEKTPLVHLVIIQENYIIPFQNIQLIQTPVAGLI